MTERSNHSYWREVDDLKDEIIDDLSVSWKLGGKGLLAPLYEHRHFGWTSLDSENFIVLDETRKRLLGRSSLRHTLTSTERLGNVEIEKELAFDPIRQHLRVHRSMQDTTDLTNATYRSHLMGRVLDAVKGVSTPEEDDYDLLITELRHGAIEKQMRKLDE